ncbi:MAG: hypothetical protein ACYCZA_10100 [Thiobacillus sp.]
MRNIALMRTLSAACCASAQAADGKLSVKLGLDYSSGNYDSQTRTETWSLPLSLKYRTDPGSLRVSTAWLRIQGAGNVTPDGDPLNTSGTVSTTEGMGDISASLTYTLIDERSHRAGLDIGGQIKLGTADETKSLGTGENDYTLYAELFKSLDNWAPFLRLGCKWKGDPAFIEYRNVWLGSVGTHYRMTPAVSIGGSYGWQQAVSQTGSPTSEALLYLNFRLSAASKLNLYAVGGFSDASPDWGSGLIFSHNY